VTQTLSKNSPTKTVGQIFKVVGGGTPTTSNPNFWNGSVPWATSADLDDNMEIKPRKKISREAIASSATNLVPAGSIVVATRVGLGKVGIARTDLCFSQDCQALIATPNVCEPKFAALQLKLRVQSFKQISRGTTIAGVTKKQLLDVRFDLPPLTEQRGIVAEIEEQFTRLETGVATLQSIQAKLKRYRAAILKAACEGKLVSTEAELARAENRSYESAEILLRHILKDRREKWNGKGKYKEPSLPNIVDLAQVPEGWTWATAEQLTDGNRSITYGVIKLGSRVPDGVPVLRSSDVRHLRLDLEDVKRVAPEIAGEYRRTFLKGGEVLVLCAVRLAALSSLQPNALSSTSPAKSRCSQWSSLR